MELKRAVIVDAGRSPFGRGGKGLLSHRDILDVAVEVVKALMARNPKVDRQCGSSMEVCHHLARELHLCKTRYGLATMCIGNGQGIATILEGIS